MKIKIGYIILGAIGLMLAISGCSTDSPLSSSTDDAGLNIVSPSVMYAVVDEQTPLAGRVETVDPATRTLTLVGVSEPVVAAEDCEIVEVTRGVELPVEFAVIEVGDSVRICGILTEENIILASKIRICSDLECPVYDVAFRDTIATIDYAARTFTVKGRSETIAVDENTLIWAQITHKFFGEENGDGHLDPAEESFKISPDEITHSRDMLYEFTDLAVGHVVEVKADIVDAETLLAVFIKVANCQEKKCIEFTATLASIDIETRTVTFEDAEYTGTVCPGAELLGTDGEPLTLADFTPGDLVEVKGFLLEDGTLNICLMVLAP